MDIFTQLENEIKNLNLKHRGEFVRNFLKAKRLLDAKNSALLAEQRKVDIELKKKKLRKLCPGGVAYYIGSNTEFLGAEMYLEKVNSKTVYARIKGNSWRIPLESVSLFPDSASRITAQKIINNFIM